MTEPSAFGVQLMVQVQGLLVSALSCDTSVALQRCTLVPGDAEKSPRVSWRLKPAAT